MPLKSLIGRAAIEALYSFIPSDVVDCQSQCQMLEQERVEGGWEQGLRQVGGVFQLVPWRLGWLLAGGWTGVASAAGAARLAIRGGMA